MPWRFPPIFCPNSVFILVFHCFRFHFVCFLLNPHLKIRDLAQSTVSSAYVPNLRFSRDGVITLTLDSCIFYLVVADTCNDVKINIYGREKSSYFEFCYICLTYSHWHVVNPICSKAKLGMFVCRRPDEIIDLFGWNWGRTSVHCTCIDFSEMTKIAINDSFREWSSKISIYIFIKLLGLGLPLWMA